MASNVYLQLKIRLSSESEGHAHEYNEYEVKNLGRPKITILHNGVSYAIREVKMKLKSYLPSFLIFCMRAISPASEQHHSYGSSFDKLQHKSTKVHGLARSNHSLYTR